jgi:hypothetical protein
VNVQIGFGQALEQLEGKPVGTWISHIGV